MKSSFSKRLKQALNTSGMKQVDVINKSKLLYEETGVKVSKTDLSQYVNGKTEPGVREFKKSTTPVFMLFHWHAVGVEQKCHG